MSLPTRGEGYAGALYTFVRRFSLMQKRTERASAIRMIVPNTAPTMAAIGAECAWFVGADAADSVVDGDMLCVTVLKAVSSGFAKLAVELISGDGLEDVAASVLVTVDAEVVVMEVTSSMNVDFEGAPEVCDFASGAASH